MKIWFNLEYLITYDCRAEINLQFLLVEHEPITILKMDKCFNEFDDDPLEYLQSYSDSDELKTFWEQFSEDELLELFETEGISVCFEFSKGTPLEIGSPENSIKNPTVVFSLNSLV